MPQSSEAHIRRSARVIRMVGELHRMGYQRLRIMPYQYGVLQHRIAIAPADIFVSGNGVFAERATEGFGEQSYDGPFAGYTSASGDNYFDWTDAKGHSARQLADKFVEKFPDLCAAGEGRDWEYAGWLAELESVLERLPSRLPIVMAEDIDTMPEQMPHLILRLYGDRTEGDDGGDKSFTLPPSAG